MLWLRQWFAPKPREKFNLERLHRHEGRDPSPRGMFHVVGLVPLVVGEEFVALNRLACSIRMSYVPFRFDKD